MASKICEKGIDIICPYGYNDMVRGSAGIGRQARLRGVCASVWVQVPSAAPRKNNHPTGGCFFLVCNSGRDLKPRSAVLRGGQNAAVSSDRGGLLCISMNRIFCQPIVDMTFCAVVTTPLESIGIIPAQSAFVLYMNETLLADIVSNSED